MKIVNRKGYIRFTTLAGLILKNMVESKTGNRQKPQYKMRVNERWTILMTSPTCLKDDVLISLSILLNFKL